MMTRCKLLFGLALTLGAFLAPTLAQNQPYAWQNVAIGGGGFVTGILFHPTTPNLIYTRTDVGGVYRWNQAAQSWVALNDDIGGLDNEFMQLGVVSFAVDPVNPARLYLATGQYTQSWAPLAQIHSSIDRGQTWTRVTLPFKLGGNEDGRSTGERLQVDPNQPRILLLGTNIDGLWRSADNGRTWRKVTSFPEARITLVEFDKTSSTYGSPTRAIYVGVQATGTNPGLFRSLDSGATWAPVAGAPTGVVPHRVGFGYGAEKTLYVAYSSGPGPNGIVSGSVWKMNGATQTWTDITPPTGQGGFAGLSVDASNSNTLVVTTMNRWFPRDEVYRSTNGGASWTTVFNSSVFDNSSAPWSVARSPHWVGDVDIDPTNPNRVMFITGYGIWASNDLTRVDSGQTVHWTFLNNELEETVPIAIASPNTGRFHLISALGDIGGFRHRYLRGSPPLADYFAPYRGTSGSIDFAANSGEQFVRSVNDGTRGQYSNNSGTSWAYFPAAAPGATENGAGFLTLSADGSRIVATPSRSGPSFSTNNGATWTPSTGGPTDLTRNYRTVADRANPNNFYLFDPGTGQVYRSLDGAVSFTVGASNLPARVSDLQAVPGWEGHLWLGTWTNGLFRSVDAGSSFIKVAGVQDANRIGFGAAAPGQTHPAVYIWGKMNDVVGLYRSDDIGATWVRINDDAHNYGFINQITGDPRIYGRVFLATGGRGIIYGQLPGTSYPDEAVDPTDPVFNARLEKPIYTDFRESPWDIWNWGVASAEFSLTNTDPVHGGTYSIKAPFTESWGQIYLNRTSFPTDGLVNLKFWVHGGAVGGQGIAVAAVRNGSVWQPAYRVPKSLVQANTWTQVVIPLSALGATNLPDVIAFGIGVYDFNYASPTPTFYLDDIVLE